MALDLSAAALIRAGSGVVYVAVGLLLLAIARGSPAARALAGFLILYGLGFAIVNPLGTDPALVPWGITIQGALFAAGAVALVAFHLRAPWRSTLSRRAEVTAIALSLALGITHAILTSIPRYIEVTQLGGYAVPWAAQSAHLGRDILSTTMVMVCAAAGFATPRNADRSRRIARGLLVVGILGYWLYSDAALLLRRGDAAFLGSVRILMLVAVAIVWIGRANLVPWGLLLLGLVGEVDAAFGNFVGGVGLARIACALLLAWAITRGNVLELPTFASRMRAGTLATGGLAALFIVAQVSQNYLSAQYGLIMGGVVAGALVFAASPIQRALERREPPGGSSRAAPSENEEAYRRALRIALNDRTVSPEEEVHLADLGERLGLRAGRARELRHEIEGEKGAR